MNMKEDMLTELRLIDDINQFTCIAEDYIHHLLDDVIVNDPMYSYVPEGEEADELAAMLDGKEGGFMLTKAGSDLCEEMYVAIYELAKEKFPNDCFILAKSLIK